MALPAGSGCHPEHRDPTGPAGVDGLRPTRRVCGGFRRAHDRAANAANDIVAVGMCPPPVRGTESSPQPAPPSRTARSRKAKDGAWRVGGMSIGKTRLNHSNLAEDGRPWC